MFHALLLQSFRFVDILGLCYGDLIALHTMILLSLLNHLNVDASLGRGVALFSSAIAWKTKCGKNYIQRECPNYMYRPQFTKSLTLLAKAMTHILRPSSQVRHVREKVCSYRQ